MISVLCGESTSIYFSVSFHYWGRFPEVPDPQAGGSRKDGGVLMCFACQHGTDDPLGRGFLTGFVS